MHRTGADISNAKLSDAGDILAEELRKFMHDLGVPNGIREFGFSASDAADLVQAAMPNVSLFALFDVSTYIAKYTTVRHVYITRKQI